jgi:hypothetical protein
VAGNQTDTERLYYMTSRLNVGALDTAGSPFINDWKLQVGSTAQVMLPQAPGASPVDSDGDGIIDDRDNCPHNFNPDQQDSDDDGVGDPCDDCAHNFDAFQTDVCGAGKTSAAAGSSTALTLKQVRLKTAPNGTVRITGTLDTTEYGGFAGFVAALRRVPAGASRASTDIRQGTVLAFNVSDAGLATPGQSMWFPPCVAVASCAGTNGENVSFFRKGATNVFKVRLTAQGKTFAPPLSSGPVTVTLSLGGLDDVDQASCRTSGRGKSASCR